MSKKKSGLLIAFGAMLGGAVAAGISYYLKLKSFNDELDQDFHEYEEEETPSEETEEKTEPAPERTYITINSGKDADAADDSEKKRRDNRFRKDRMSGTHRRKRLCKRGKRTGRKNILRCS